MESKAEPKRVVLGEDTLVAAWVHGTTIIGIRKDIEKIDADQIGKKVRLIVEFL